MINSDFIQVGAERLNINNFTNMGWLLRNFFTNFDLEKTKEGHIKIHGQGAGDRQFDIFPLSFTVILLTTFEFQHFVT